MLHDFHHHAHAESILRSVKFLEKIEGTISNILPMVANNQEHDANLHGGLYLFACFFLGL
jgi:hypothetical protein